MCQFLLKPLETYESSNRQSFYLNLIMNCLLPLNCVIEFFLQSIGLWVVRCTSTPANSKKLTSTHVDLYVDINKKFYMYIYLQIMN